MQNTTFKHQTPIQLRFNDFDVLGHVNNAIYLSFFDLGKTEYFNNVLPELVFDHTVGMVIADIHVSFLLPVYPGEKVAVETCVVEVGNKSFKLYQRLVDLVSEEVKCICNTVMVCFDAQTKSSREVPQEWRLAIADFEENPLLSKHPK